MFFDKEMEITVDVAERKIRDILDGPKEFTAQSLRDLETLFKLKDAAENQLHLAGKKDAKTNSCECVNWARTDMTADGKFSKHHPNCSHRLSEKVSRR